MSAETEDVAVVIGTGSPGSVTAVRSIGRRGVHTVVASELSSPPSAASKYCDETVPLPDPEDRPAYAEALRSLASRPEVRAVLPGRPVDAFVLANHRDALAEHVAPLWPDRDRLETVHDRLELQEAATAAGVPSPDTRSVDDVDDWATERVVKSRYAMLTPAYDEAIPADSANRPPGTVYVDPGSTPDRDALVSEMGHVPIAQEYVAGDEYAFRALYDRGEPVLTSQIRQHRAFHYPGGASVYRESVHDPRLDELGRALLDELEWHGLAEVEFLRPADGDDYLLMEVNPRLWGSLSTDLRAGADFPWALWRTAGGASLPEETAYETGVGTHLLRGELSYLHSVRTASSPLAEPPEFGEAVRDVAASFVRHPDCDYLWYSDPRPLLADLRGSLGGLLF